MTIKVRLLLTVACIVLLSTGFLGVYSYRNQIRLLEENYQDLARKEHRLFETILIEDAEGLSLALTGLGRLEPLLRPFAAGDREALLDAARPIFEELESQHFITHMYFINPDGRVLLRVHKPSQHGDRLQRATFLEAAATRRAASGLEMGKNFFSLRCVTPVYLEGELIGYMEVGEEIDHIFEQMKAITGNDVSIFLPTEYLDRYGVDWPALGSGDFALLYPTSPEVTVGLAEPLYDAIDKGLDGFSVRKVDLDSEQYAVGLAPLRDAFGDKAGILLSQRNVSLQYATIWRGLTISLAVFLAILAGGNILLYVSLRKSFDLFQNLRRHIQELTRTWRLDTPLPVTTTDEIGELAEDLNRMKAEIGKLNAALKDRNVELSAANRELESFSYTLSHDLKLPLTRIYSGADMLRDGYAESLDETGCLLLDHICAGSEQMEELIESILKLARISSRELVRERVDLAAMARQIAADLGMTEPDRPITWVIPPALEAAGDPHLLKAALTNLLENAWKYTRPVAQATIEIGQSEQEGERTFFIRDNGIGFDMKLAEKLFKPFKRLHEENGIPGSGIGLATVQRIIHRHGGEVRAVGAEGKGATFYFTLPERTEGGNSSLQ